MEKEWVPYEPSVRLKALGFSEPCFKYVYTGDTGTNVNHYLEVEPSKAKNYNADDLCVSRPTFSQAFRWFIENYNIVGEINSYYSDKKWSFNYDVVTIFKEKASDRFDTYEEAELALLHKLIETVESKAQ